MHSHALTPADQALNIHQRNPIPARAAPVPRQKQTLCSLSIGHQERDDSSHTALHFERPYTVWEPYMMPAASA